MRGASGRRPKHSFAAQVAESVPVRGVRPQLDLYVTPQRIPKPRHAVRAQDAEGGSRLASSLVTTQPRQVPRQLEQLLSGCGVQRPLLGRSRHDVA
jgi:hypothetical protein